MILICKKTISSKTFKKIILGFNSKMGDDLKKDLESDKAVFIEGKHYKMNVNKDRRIMSSEIGTITMFHSSKIMEALLQECFIIFSKGEKE